MKTNHILIFVAIILFFSGCQTCTKNNRVANTVTNTEVFIPKEQTEELVQEIKIDSTSQKRLFYSIFKDTVYTYAKFKIIDDKIVLNYLDMEWFGYHISRIDHKGDSIIQMNFDKEVNLARYDEGKIVLFDSYLKNMSMLKNRQNYIWEIYINDEVTPYKYLIIDSLDLQIAGYEIDTVNHWLDDVDF